MANYYCLLTELSIPTVRERDNFQGPGLPTSSSDLDVRKAFHGTSFINRDRDLDVCLALTSKL